MWSGGAPDLDAKVKACVAEALREKGIWVKMIPQERAAMEVRVPRTQEQSSQVAARVPEELID